MPPRPWGHCLMPLHLLNMYIALSPNLQDLCLWEFLPNGERPYYNYISIQRQCSPYWVMSLKWWAKSSKCPWDHSSDLCINIDSCDQELSSVLHCLHLTVIQPLEFHGDRLVKACRFYSWGSPIPDSLQHNYNIFKIGKFNVQSRIVLLLR